MATWKKIIVSGSQAHLAGATGSFTGSFVGDGSSLSGVSGEFPSTPKGGTSFDAVKFFTNDGASKFASGSQVAAYAFGKVSGDITIAADGTAAIQANSLTLGTDTTGDFVGTVTAGSGINSTGASTGEDIDHTLSVDSASMQTFFAQATFASASGDVTFNSSGVAAIQANSVALGTDTTGDYVESLTAGALIDLQNNSGEGATPTIDVDLTEASEAAIANGDYIIFLDGGATGTHAKEAIADVATLFAGTGLTATNSVIAVDYGTSAGTALEGDTTVDDVSVANLKTALSSNLTTLTIGDSNDTITIPGNLTVSGTTTEVQTTNLNIEDQFILINSGALKGSGLDAAAADKDGGLIVDFGGGSGSALFYDANHKAWGIRGTNHAEPTSNFLSYNAESNINTSVNYDYTISVVTSSAVSPSADPVYGNSATNSNLGTMHINNANGEIWIYS